MNILLIQLRHEERQRAEQLACILRFSGLSAEQVTCINAFEETVDPALAHNFDAVIIGGSAEYNVSRHEPAHIDDIAELVRVCEREEIPLFGICYGAHLIAYALGGTVVYAPERKELGTFLLTKTAEAAQDVVFGGAPQQFLANIGHTDDIVELPQHGISLCSSELIAHHAFTISGKPIYGVQFHPELDKEDLLKRFASAYDFGGYFDSEEEYNRRCATVEDTPDSGALLKKFFDRVVFGDGVEKTI